MAAFCCFLLRRSARLAAWHTVGDSCRHARRWPKAARIRQVIGVLVLHWLALGITIAVMPGISATATWSVLLAAVALGVAGTLLRPLIVPA
jgi:hypothetical protein